MVTCVHDTYLSVKDLQGKTHIISFAPPFVTVGNIKKHIEEVTRIPIDQQRLVFNGRQVDDTFNMGVVLLRPTMGHPETGR